MKRISPKRLTTASLLEPDWMCMRANHWQRIHLCDPWSVALVLTPHLGASTEEAQENVAIDVAEQIRDVLLGLPARSAVNIPGLSAEIMERLKPQLQLSETLGLLVSQLAGGQVQELELRLQGEFAKHPSQPLVIAALKGMLSSAAGGQHQLRECILEAKARGIHVLEVKDESSRDFAGGSLQLTSKWCAGWTQCDRRCLQPTENFASPASTNSL